jgi:hypothetical protein
MKAFDIVTRLYLLLIAGIKKASRDSQPGRWFVAKLL